MNKNEKNKAKTNEIQISHKNLYSKYSWMKIVKRNY